MQPTPIHARILKLDAAGKSPAEIAAETGATEEVILEVLDTIQPPPRVPPPVDVAKDREVSRARWAAWRQRMAWQRHHGYDPNRNPLHRTLPPSWTPRWTPK
jgi:hypothetical protein